MKKWRVGTLSMGLTLVLLGGILFASQWQGQGAFDAFIVWWPLLLILLGLEIVTYLLIAKKDNPVIYYDVFSIFFVSVLCVGCLGFTLLTSTGVVSEVRQLLHTVEQTEDLPDVESPVGPEVKRIVVSTSGEQVKIDKGTQPQVRAFGTYRKQTAGEQAETALKPEQYCLVRTVGDTMYVQVKSLPTERGLRSYVPRMALTLVLPQDRQVEVRGPGNRVLEP